MRIELKINSAENKMFSDVTITKTYGEMWKKDSSKGIHYIDINQLIGGVTKQYLFEVQIPPINKKL